MASENFNNKDSATPEVRKRDRAKTTQELELALHRLQKAGKRVSVNAVAKEASVTPALIHNRYAEFAEKVRVVMGKATREQRDEKHGLLQKERERNRYLRELVDKQLKEITDLASINESLRAEIELLKAVADGKVVRGHFSKVKDNE